MYNAFSQAVEGKFGISTYTQQFEVNYVNSYLHQVSATCFVRNFVTQMYHNLLKLLNSAENRHATHGQKYHP